MTAPTSATDLQAVAEFIANFVSNPALALQLAQDPQGTIVANGLEDEVGQVNLHDAMLQACQTPGFPPDAASAIQSYVSGGGGGGGGGYTAPPPPAHGPAPVEHVVQQLQYVNYVTHEGDTTIQQTIIDQSTSVNVGDNFTGNIDFDVDNAAATGAGSVAGGEGDVNAATGEGSQVIDDSTVGQNQNSSDGAVQVGQDANAPIVTAANSGVINDGDIDAPVLVGSTNTGTINDGTIDGPVLSNSTNTGVVADGNVDDTVIGNNNQGNNADIDESDGVVLSFGEGSDVNAVGGNVTGSALGDENAVGNSVGPGGVVETGDGSAQGTFNDNDTTTTTTTNNTETNTVSATDSVVTTEQGPGDNEGLDNSFQDNSLPEPLKMEAEAKEFGGDHDDDAGAA